MTEHTIGIDISKSHLDAFRLEDGAAQRFENAPRGFRALIKWLGTGAVARIVYEPTGPYHRAFEQALSGKFPLVKVNPLQARRFAESCGTRAKTDAVDARILARMGAALALEHVAEKWEPVFCFSNMRYQEVRVWRVNANERDTLWNRMRQFHRGTMTLAIFRSRGHPWSRSARACATAAMFRPTPF